jgi:uncharacterized protein YdgA (DUF945 family)
LQLDIGSLDGAALRPPSQQQQQQQQQQQSQRWRRQQLAAAVKQRLAGVVLQPSHVALLDKLSFMIGACQVW